MKECKKCGTIFEPVKGLLAYCSISCRNSRGVRSIETKTKISNTLKGRKSTDSDETIKKRIESYKKTIAKKRLLRIEAIKQTPFEDLSRTDRRTKIFYEQDCRCNRCHRNKWLDQDIPLELEHKDGNNSNNHRDNLELLCPNCHALTSTWRGRNKSGNKSLRKKISDETLLTSLLNHNWNIRQALIEVGLAPKGGNYSRCYQIKKNYLEG